MQFISNLFSKIGLFLFVMILLILSLYLMTKQSDFHKNAIGRQAIVVNGVLSKKVSNITKFWNAPKENERLIKENAYLRNKLGVNPKQEIRSVDIITKTDSLHLQQYSYQSANIIDYTIRKKDNYFLIDKGSKDGVHSDMAVITSNGIVGTVINVSENYASVLSILHSKSKIKARVLGLDYYGILEWDGKDHRYLSLTEMPKYLKISQGDTIVTAGESAVFPEGISLGRIADIKPNDTTGDFEIMVELFNDLAKTRNVYVVENLKSLEIKKAKEKEDDFSQ